MVKLERGQKVAGAQLFEHGGILSLSLDNPIISQAGCCVVGTPYAGWYVIASVKPAYVCPVVFGVYNRYTPSTRSLTL